MKNENIKKPFYENIAKKNTKAKVDNSKSQNNKKGKIEKSAQFATKNEKNNFLNIKNVKNSQNAFCFTKNASLFSKLSPNDSDILCNFDQIVQNCRPLNSKQLQELPYDIKNLSLQLTSERNTRRLGYMNSQAELSAYIRYFCWWNLFRLCSVFTALNAEFFENFKDNDAVLDIGSGPLTVPIALWLSVPALRCKKLTIYVMDNSSSALAVGEELFLSVVSKTLAGKSEKNEENGKNIEQNIEPWNIVRIKGEFGTEIKKPVSAVFAANMFNELLQNSTRTKEEDAKRHLKTILNYTKPNASVFIAEPAGPNTARFISLLRDGLLRKGFSITSPCPHENTCPMPGTKKEKYCHFVLNGETAPEKLKKLSSKANLSKERASISFVAAYKNENILKLEEKEENLTLRICSDIIKLPQNQFGRYACCKNGLALIEGKSAFSLFSGDCISVKITQKKLESLKIDAKTGAKIIPLQNERAENIKKGIKEY